MTNPLKLIETAQVLDSMAQTEWFDHNSEALFAHLAADYWRWVAFSRQSTVRRDQLRGVADATYRRLDAWRQLVLDNDYLARQQLQAEQTQRRILEAQAQAEHEERLAADRARAVVLGRAMAMLEDEAVASMACPYCQAEPGAWCVHLPTGRPAGPHATRVGALAVALTACPHCTAAVGEWCDANHSANTTHRVRREQAAMMRFRQTHSLDQLAVQSGGEHQ
jgi:hypothetical protein